jgi:hypothetical protein
MPSDPPGLPTVVTRAQALAAGMTPDEVRQRVRGGHWTALLPGTYARRSTEPDLDPFEAQRVRHVELCTAAALRHPGTTIAFGSAALATSLPLVSDPPPLGQLIASPGGWTGIRDGVRYRSAALRPSHVVDRGVRVTSPARTVVDVARTHDLPDALACGDAAVRRGLTDVASALTLLDSLGSVRGCRRARAALVHLDGRRESPLESFSWARFLEAGLPLPLMQEEFWDEDGFVGRVDFWWPQFRLVGEVDGRMKYSTADAIYAEKRREDRIRRLGVGVERWGMPELGRGWPRFLPRLTARLR